jgi:glucokinase
LPTAAALAVAAPVGARVLKFTNSAWTVEPGRLPMDLCLEDLTLVNDFGAVAHAVASLPSSDFSHLCGPDAGLPAEGAISVLGPGTGLGVAMLVRSAAGHQVVETEASHIAFAPLDEVEDRIVASLRDRFGRVSAERIVSGPGLANIHDALAIIEGAPAPPQDQAQLWRRALSAEDDRAAKALSRFCLALGAVAGDIALAQGARGVVLSGGLAQRLAPHLAASGFVRRFTAKGRFEAQMAEIPVKLLQHPQPGLYGAAAAFAGQHCTAQEPSAGPG